MTTLNRKYIIEYNNERFYISPDHLTCYYHDTYSQKDISIEPESKPYNLTYEYDIHDYILFIITNRCNTTCKYCFRNFINKKSSSEGNEININDFIEIIGLFKAKTNSDKKTIQFSGGELFIKKNIERYFEGAIEKGFRVWLSTNGISDKICSDTILDIFRNNPQVHVRISLDGHMPKIHEQYRQRGTFAKVLSNIKKLTLNNVSVSVKSVITADNFQYLEYFLDFIYELEISGFTYNVIRKTGQWNSGIKEISHLLIIKKLVEIVYRKPHLSHMLGLTPFGKLLDNIYSRKPTLLSAIGYVVNYNGDVFIHDNLFYDEYKIGNYFKDGLTVFSNDEMFNLRNKLDLNKISCQKCYANRFCLKGDYGELYIIDKTLNAEFPNCEDLRESFLYSISLKENILAKVIDEQ